MSFVKAHFTLRANIYIFDHHAVPEEYFWEVARFEHELFTKTTHQSLLGPLKFIHCHLSSKALYTTEQVWVQS